nr:hypothetical protein [uncultured Flavobacterium sp.]
MTTNNSTINKLKEPQILISLLYALAVGIGMIFNYSKYKLYGINIFDYADLTDCLLSPFSDLTILLLIFAFIFYYLDVAIKAKYPKFYDFNFLKKIKYANLSALITLAVFITAITVFAKQYSKKQFKNIDQEKNITIQTKNNIIKGKYLGKTKDVLFVIEDNEVKIIPITSNIDFYKLN